MSYEVIIDEFAASKQEKEIFKVRNLHCLNKYIRLYSSKNRG